MHTDVDATCRGKVKHDTRGEARSTADAMRRKPNIAGRLSTYRCPYCDTWHVGRISPAQAKRQNGKNRGRRDFRAA